MRVTVIVCLEDHERRPGDQDTARVCLPPIAAGADLAEARRDADSTFLPAGWEHNPAGVVAARLAAAILHVPYAAVLGTVTPLPSHHTPVGPAAMPAGEVSA